MKAWLRFVSAGLLTASLGCTTDHRQTGQGEVFGQPKKAQEVDEISEKLDETEASPDKTDETFSNKGSVSNSDLKKLGEAVRSKNDRAVIKEVSSILGKDPNNLEALNALAIHHFQQKRFGLAKIILGRALKKNPDEPSLQNNLGVIHLAEGDLRSALVNFRDSIKASASYQPGAANLASIYVKYRDYDRALGGLEDSFTEFKSDLGRGDSTAIEIANNYGVALMGAGESQKAEEVLEKVTHSKSRNPVPFLNYAILLVEVLKKKNDAMRTLSKLKFMTEDREILRRVQELEARLNTLK